jgi:ribosome biogenesis GTPase / thiamine phosphate phosphatase
VNRNETRKDNESRSAGVVVRASVNLWDVHVDGRTISCVMAGRLRHESDDRPVVGDDVRVSANGGGGMIVEMLPRRSQISRRAAGRKASQQVLAANVDQMLCVFAAADPTPHWNLLDRYLVEA